MNEAIEQSRKILIKKKERQLSEKAKIYNKILEKLQRGDYAAIGKIIGKSREGVRGIITKCLGSLEQAKIIQEIFTKIEKERKNG